MKTFRIMLQAGSILFIRPVEVYSPNANDNGQYPAIGYYCEFANTDNVAFSWSFVRTAEGGVRLFDSVQNMLDNAPAVIQMFVDNGNWGGQ